MIDTTWRCPNCFEVVAYASAHACPPARVVVAVTAETAELRAEVARLRALLSTARADQLEADCARVCALCDPATRGPYLPADFFAVGAEPEMWQHRLSAVSIWSAVPCRAHALRQAGLVPTEN